MRHGKLVGLAKWVFYLLHKVNHATTLKLGVVACNMTFRSYLEYPTRRVLSTKQYSLPNSRPSGSVKTRFLEVLMKKSLATSFQSVSSPVNFHSSSTGTHQIPLSVPPIRKLLPRMLTEVSSLSAPSVAFLAMSVMLSTVILGAA